jgi:hypothetical protein
MEILLAPERMFQLQPRISLDQAHARVEEKKLGLVAGTLGNLLSRPKPDEIGAMGWLQRWDPFWHVVVHVRTVYDRQRPFSVPVGGPEVKRVTIAGQTLLVEAQAKGGPAFVVTGVEHCEEDQRLVRFLSGDGAPAPEAGRLVDLPKAEVTDLSLLTGEGVHFVAPGLSSAALVRQVVAEVVRPVKAQAIHEERVELEVLDLYVRPVYAFEYHWAAKGKRAVLECDGLTGEVRAGGPSLKDHLRTMLNRDMLFDLSAEAVGLMVPGGGIVVKLTKAAMDLKK